MNKDKTEGNEMLRREMLDSINQGGAWFIVPNKVLVKIGRDPASGLLFARECRFKDDVLECSAYSFGTDWFDISFHGPYIDIFADAESFQRWDIWYDTSKGTLSKTRDDGKEPSLRLVEFCTQADKEALSGTTNPYIISGTNFSKIIV